MGPRNNILGRDEVKTDNNQFLPHSHKGFPLLGVLWGVQRILRYTLILPVPVARAVETLFLAAWILVPVVPDPSLFVAAFAAAAAAPWWLNVS